ncbi:MAG: hypothetical protein IPK93_01115 [Solirubrobacterales bacterium]|nr:hypothetical protein [Solirubrobacterales bacterium]
MNDSEAGSRQTYIDVDSPDSQRFVGGHVKRFADQTGRHIYRALNRLEGFGDLDGAIQT